MVKPDIKRNYYADLELPNDASVDDIKKSYRKLALKYHPDRNPGREDEFSPKFQAIQAAHEVLEDAATKARYDADRRKAGLVGGYGRPNVPPRNTPTNPTNPYQATSAYPPPPRRTPNPTASWRTTNQGTSGADRFTNFPKPAPTSKKDTTDRSNVFNAWQNMNHAKSHPTSASGTQSRPEPQRSPQRSPQRPRPPPPPRQETRFPTEEDIRAGMNYRQAPSSGQANFRSAWAEYNTTNATKPGPPPNLGRSNTTKAPRKAGFDPNAGGDEGQAANTANYSSSRRKSADPPLFPPPPPRDVPSAFSSASHADPPFTQGSRMKTPYSAHIGQQTYSSSDDVHRNDDAPPAPSHAQSTSEPTSRPQTSTRRPAGRGTARRPFYVRDDSSDDSETEEESTDTSPEFAKPNDKPSDDAENSDNPFLPRSFTRPKKTPNPPSRQFKNGTPFKAPTESSQGGMSGNNANVDADTSGNPSEKSKPTMYGSTFPFSTTPAHPEKNTKPRPFYSQEDCPDRPVFGRNGDIPSWAFPSTVRPPVKRNLSAAQQAWHDFASTESAASWGNVQPAPTSTKTSKLSVNSKWVQSDGCSFQDSQPLKKHCFTKKDVAHLFDMPVNYDTMSPNTAKSRSEDNINTAFTPAQWSGTFTGNVFATAGAGRPSPPARKGSRNFRPQPSVVQGAVPGSSRQPSDAGQQNSTTSPPPQPVKFSAEEWANKFQEPKWVFDPETLRSASPHRPGSRTLRSESTARKGSRVSNKVPVNTPKPATVADEEDEVAADAAPEHIASSVDAMDVDDTPPASDLPPSSAFASSAAQEPRVYPVNTAHLRQTDAKTHQTAANPSSKRESAGAFQTKLDDLANVINTPAEGLDGLSDIRTNLPFDSKASTSNPSKTFTPQVLQLPSLPRAPAEPTKLTKTSWAEYCRAVATYLEKFDKFNSALLDHFATRQIRAAKLVKSGVRALEAIGEASTTTGFPSYAQAVKEDERVREHWNIGCEKHVEAIKAFEAVRERVRSLSEGAGLADV